MPCNWTVFGEWSCNGALSGGVSGTYVMPGMAISAALMFHYIAVSLRDCGYDGAKDVIVNGSF